MGDARQADREYMARALGLAQRGLFTTSPNPRVGCVLVSAGTVVGEGWHERAGGPHAEVVALRAAGAAAKGATAYVTLDPCNHQGRTPPCANALIDAGIRRVVAAMRDPNPAVCGAGFQTLRAAGVEVDSGMLGEEARELNIGFVARNERGTPWVRLKIAASLDGKTALANGVSQWITGPEARRDGHAWRARACAVLTGIGTVIEDDPRLTVRDVATPRQPLRILVDSRMEVSPQAKLLVGGGVLIVAARDDAEKRKRLTDLGAEVIVLPNPAGKVDLAALMGELGQRALNEVHIEAGFKLNGSLLREGIIDELLLYMAPSILGDAARGMFHLPEFKTLAERHELDIRDLARIGNDIRILARVVKKQELGARD
jgi:diaminohydroxyphosphoribosylaminopyrimidine deaminase/5-amino-6-(5-phosphoribosylamino)uracil reductase